MQALSKLLPDVIDIAKRAGSVIEHIAQTMPLDVQKKEDHSPVTQADIAASDLICAELQKLTPNIPVISEEDAVVAVEARLSWPCCWLVDPLDGTRGFIDGSGQYTVNIALIENHQPVLGVIYGPQLNKQLYYAAKGEGAFFCENDQVKQIKSCSFDRKRTIHIAVSQYHGSKWLEKLLSDLTNHQLVRMNSSVKIAFVAAGVADIYPRLGPTSEWDTAAGQCIVEEAGGVVINLDGQPLTYNARHTLINPGFMVVGDPQQQTFFIDLIKQARSDR